MPVLVGKSNGLTAELYSDGAILVFTIVDYRNKQCTHWHPLDAHYAIADMIKFMEGKCDYKLQPFAKQ